MTKSFITVCSVFFLIAVVSGQAAADLANKYRHHEIYEVQPGVQMTPKFASDGRVCEMQVEQAHFGESGADLRDGLDQATINPIIDQLVPQEERGEKINDLEECVGACEAVDEYANVFVRVCSSKNTRLITIEWRNRRCR